MIEVELPDGTIAEFPDGTPETVMRTALLKRTAGPDVTTDVVKSAASGVPRGVADLIGLPGTIGDAARGGMQWLMRKGYEGVTGEEPTPEGGVVERFFAGNPEMEAQMIGGGSNPLSGQNLRKVLSSATGGATDYQPQTIPGEYARTAGEFAGSAIAGPGGLFRKAAMTAVPAVASETAGQATKGTAWEPWARAAGAFGGGLLSAGKVNVAKEAAKGAPTKDALKQTADDLYSQLRSAGIKYDANAWGQTVQSMSNDLLKAGFRPSVAKDAFGLVDDLMKQTNHSLDFDDLNGLVRMVGGAARDAAKKGDSTSATAFGIIRDKLDDFERNAVLTTNKSIPANELTALRTSARQTALKNIKQRALDEIASNAETYQSGLEAGMRNGIGNLLRSKKGQQLFSGAERTALLEVAQGRKSLRTLSRFGLDLERLSGNASALPTVGALGAGTLLEPMAGGALLALGTGAKLASPRLTQRAFDQASSAIRSGNLAGTAGKELTKRLKDEQLLRRLLAGAMGTTALKVPTGGQ